MRVSEVTHSNLVPRSVGALVIVAGAAAIFATYWDEAWHTDVGRDSFWSPPHVLLYGSVAIVGLGVAAWGLRVVVGERTLRAAFGAPSLMLAGASGLAVLVAAPVDAAWHAEFGRDAVAWSPPHMLVLLGSTALVLGVLAGLPHDAVALRAGAGTLLMANSVAAVFEYEADVPQFAEVWYLPLLLVGGLLAASVVRAAVPVRAPVTTVVLAYAGLRLAVIGGLALLGRSTPDLPVAVLGLAALDLPLRTRVGRVTIASLTTAGLAWAASALTLASPDPTEVGVAAVFVAATSAVALVARRVGRSTVVAVLVVGVAVALPIVGPTVPGWAHDPGQGDPLTRIRLEAVSDSRGAIQVLVEVHEHCDDLEPQGVAARRAGSVRSAQLVQTADCAFAGTVEVDPIGRWFTYVEFRHDGADVEAWVPVDADHRSAVDETRVLYRPAGASTGATTSQVLAGMVLYLVGGLLVAAGVRLNLRRPPWANPEQARLTTSG